MYLVIREITLDVLVYESSADQHALQVRMNVIPTTDRKTSKASRTNRQHASLRESKIHVFGLSKTNG